MYTIGQKLSLVDQDWHFELRSPKNEAQRRGLALDIHVKRDAIEHGFIVSSEVFGPWDWAMDSNVLVDTKSTSTGSISISGPEMMFTNRHIESGGTMLHAVFTQNDDSTFTFQGFVDVSILIQRDLIHCSKIDPAGVYYFLGHARKFLC